MKTETIILNFSTAKKKDVKFKSKQTCSPNLFKKGKRTCSDDISYEDKVLLDKAGEDFKNNRLVSHKEIMRFLDD